VAVVVGMEGMEVGRLNRGGARRHGSRSGRGEGAQGAREERQPRRVREERHGVRGGLHLLHARWI
jgi:hypothetical protein